MYLSLLYNLAFLNLHRTSISLIVSWSLNISVSSKDLHWAQLYIGLTFPEQRNVMAR